MHNEYGDENEEQKAVSSEAKLHDVSGESVDLFLRLHHLENSEQPNQFEEFRELADAEDAQHLVHLRDLTGAIRVRVDLDHELERYNGY